MKTLKLSFGLAVFVSVLSVLSPNVFASATTTCPIVPVFMKYGVNNKAADVTALQAFLKNQEKIEVTVSGVFDEETVKAVEVFQKRYATEVLAPWDATKASGIVYLTTSKKINQIACEIPLSLNEKELTIINNYKKGVVASLGQENASTTPMVVEVEGETAPSAAAEKDTTQTAAIGGGTLVQRFWWYFVNLF